MKTIKRILSVHKVAGFKIFCLFNNGESRIIDFEALFKKWNVSENDAEYLIATEEKEFQKVELIDGTLTWGNIGAEALNEDGEQVSLPYDIDPIVLYENSELDESRQLEIGLLVKKSRTELGLTQAQLAKKSGTTKHYISRVENNKTGIEVATLKKIIEGGLGKRLKISIA